MPDSSSSRRWVFAVLTAVAFPALALHSTCIAVMGPGTWGSGMEELLPEFKPPTAEVDAYRLEFESQTPTTGIADQMGEDALPTEVDGKVAWFHQLGERTVYLTEAPAGRLPRQRLYVSSSEQRLREVPIPRGHIVARPQWTSDGLVYVRWNPWAIPPSGKLRRYVASWFDTSSRPEAALYGDTDATGTWRFLMPGHSVTVSPDGRRAALLRSGALLAGYYSIHAWQVGSADAPAVLSLREHDGNATGSFRMRWSGDSSALFIQGRTGGFHRKASHAGAGPDGIQLNLIYLAGEQTVYDLNLGG